MEKKLIYKTFIFFERKSINYLAIFYLFFSVIVLFMNVYLENALLSDFFINRFYSYLNNNNSELITIATIFIGIYFSVYTILMSSTEGSAFNRLSIRNKIALIKILNKGFVSSFLYVIFSLFLSFLYGLAPLLSTVIMLGFLILFFYSALVFGLDMFVLIKADIEKNIKS